jgi:hypothetical protein
MWTHSKHRRRGFGRKMMDSVREALVGQHVYLFTDDQEAFYASCRFACRGAGLERVVGRWLESVDP